MFDKVWNSWGMSLVRLVAIIIIASTMSSCVSNDVVVIDGCEYIQTQTYANGVRATLVHKGNCKNPIHNQSVIKEIKTEPNIDTPKVEYLDLSNLK